VSNPLTAESVIHFWFEVIEPKQWFQKDDAFDELITQRFMPLYQQAIKNELYHWRQSAKGRLAEIILLDQFSRNMYRNSGQAFAYDSLAVALCQEAIAQKADQQLNNSEKSFLYMPLMHSESLVVHELAVKMFAQKGLEGNYEFELKHKRIIEQFGRYPHRNALLNRHSTDTEVVFLTQPNSSF
jgi:uncharacterized protein (DUF924 family)